MPPTPGFFATILNSKAQHWGDSGTKLAFDTVGGLMPLWGQGLLLLLFARSYRWLELFGNGELALYSAAFFASALYLVVKDYRQTQFVRRAVFSLIGFAALSVSAIIFAGPTAVRILEVPIHVDKRTVLTLSLPVFCLSVLFTVIVGVLDGLRIDPDPRGLAQEQQKRLNAQFDKLENP